LQLRSTGTRTLGKSRAWKNAGNELPRFFGTDRFLSAPHFFNRLCLDFFAPPNFVGRSLRFLPFISPRLRLVLFVCSLFLLWLHCKTKSIQLLAIVLFSLISFRFDFSDAILACQRSDRRLSSRWNLAFLHPPLPSTTNYHHHHRGTAPIISNPTVERIPSARLHFPVAPLQHSPINVSHCHLTLASALSHASLAGLRQLNRHDTYTSKPVESTLTSSPTPSRALYAPLRIATLPLSTENGQL